MNNLLNEKSKKNASMIPSWRSLKSLGTNRIIRSSYIWVVVVPIAAKIIPEIQKIFVSQGVNVNLALPFSWHFFYFSAVFFAMASFIFAMKCPWLIKNYDSPLQYSKDGKGQLQLEIYAKHFLKKYYRNNFQEYIDSFERLSRLKESSFNSQYWYLIRRLQESGSIWRVLCVANYTLGFIFLIIIMVENFLYVWKSFMNGFN